MITWDFFTNIIAVDFEYYGEDTEPKTPICYTAKNLRTGELISHWVTDQDTQPLYPCDPSSLFIAYNCPAEMACHLSLNFPFPLYILDLYAEYCNLTNGKLIKGERRGLIEACEKYRIEGGDKANKEAKRKRIQQGPPFYEHEKPGILEYNKTDVDLTEKLFFKMQKQIHLNQALLRGRYMGCTAKVERRGIPVDVEKYNEILACWDILKEELIFEMDKSYQVYDGIKFSNKKFNEFLIKNNIIWSYTATGLPVTNADFFKEQVKVYPILRDLYELRSSISQLRLKDLAIGKDNRNHFWANPFGSITGRNQPSSNESIFGPATWIRSFIKPELGKAIAYIDFSQEEMGVAAALSNDLEMKKAYNSGDMYLTTAKLMKVVPESATKQSHKTTRDVFKIVSLAINYGQKAQGCARQANIHPTQAALMIDFIKKKYKRFFDWNAAFFDTGVLRQQMSTRFGLLFDPSNQEKINTLINWPIQATASDILKVSVCLCEQHNISIIAMVHDALLIESTEENIETDTRKTQKLMEDASEAVLHFRLKTDTKIVHYPDRYMDERGEGMWNTIWKVLDKIDPAEKQARIFEKINQNISLDDFNTPTVPIQKNMSKRRKGQLLLKPVNMTEKNLSKRIQQKSHLSFVEVMALIRLARDSDYDLEEEVDWPNESYTSAKKKILMDINPSRTSMKQLSSKEK